MIIENQLPIISIQALTSSLPYDDPKVQAESNLLMNAARDWGFLYIKDHGVPDKILENLETCSKEFFKLPLELKNEIRMSKGGKAWRGYFHTGAEFTSGIPDIKEGIYFGSELDQCHPKVEAGIPLHGANLWLDGHIPSMKETVLEYMNCLSTLSKSLMRGFAISLGLDEEYFMEKFGKHPTVLFRIFNYPETEQVEGWGVGEHTDYGFLTILKTDDHPGLQVLSPNQEWIDAQPLKGTFIVNIGDQLEIATRGLLKATPHRVELQRQGDRLSWPFFFDPNWEAFLEPIGLGESKVIEKWLENGGILKRKAGKRWDGKDLSQEDFRRTYGDYVMDKVSRCFPELFKSVC